MPYLLAELDREGLSATLRRSYELVVSGTPGEMQDEGHETLRILMLGLRYAVASRNRCSSPGDKLGVARSSVR